MFGLFSKNKKEKYYTPESKQVMELEFRRKDGSYLFSMVGDFARRSYLKFCIDPDLVKTTKNLGPEDRSSGSKEYVVFKCVNRSTFLLLESIEAHLEPGDYIKIISK